MTEGLISPKQPDGFTHESPIRAFTEFRVAGTWAIGKGFRPSLAHLHTYLDAMQHKEGWQLVQLLEGGTLDPTMIFQRDRIMSFTLPRVMEPIADSWTEHGSDEPIPPRYERELLAHMAVRLNVVLDTLERDYNKTACNEPAGTTGHWRVRSNFRRFKECPCLNGIGDLRIKRAIDDFRVQSAVAIADDPVMPEVAAKRLADDPINPKHYAGRECADIGERLSGNGYQILKYVWRLGKKDDPCVEIGKAIWYAESEAALMERHKLRLIRPHLFGAVRGKVPGAKWLESRIADQPTFTQNIARMLWSGYDRRGIQAIIEALNEHKFHLDCGRGLAI